MTDNSIAAVAIPAVAVLLFIIISCYLSVCVVREREVMVIERFGKFNSILIAGVHFIIPWIDWPKKYSYRYWVEDPLGGQSILKVGSTTRINTQNEVIDFPKQRVITRDNASVSLDAVLSYRIVNAKQMIYSVNNLPLVLSKLLQSHLRNVAGGLDIDQIIEESASLNIITGILDNESSKWGVKINFVKIQRVDAHELTNVLSQKKTADLQNKEIIINAKAKRQTKIIESEGQRDSMIKKAEGEAQEIVSKARGEAQAIVNAANAEAKTIREISRAIMVNNKDPNVTIQYLIANKYIEALRFIVAQKETKVYFMPQKSIFLQTANEMGFNTIIPSGTKI